MGASYAASRVIGAGMDQAAFAETRDGVTRTRTADNS
jgi:hypothetical protein